MQVADISLLKCIFPQAVRTMGCFLDLCQASAFLAGGEGLIHPPFHPMETKTIDIAETCWMLGCCDVQHN